MKIRSKWDHRCEIQSFKSDSARLFKARTDPVRLLSRRNWNKSLQHPGVSPDGHCKHPTEPNVNNSASV
ncbi:unnamed protein product [Chondrus crispus]|uniref:Uncharacterized protein n=1 Tax=Chondrus crispus TaxID=2769 RepID=R7QGY2_CHOCR|nr:unnamed protein product [Chondrus crispus]CDF37787.1 unnamed protein product [Chondrus crispus]|eukprot:XP_005717658.1 unnamed protein product [Chondrus crispus]